MGVAQGHVEHLWAHPKARGSSSEAPLADWPEVPPSQFDPDRSVGSIDHFQRTGFVASEPSVRDARNGLVEFIVGFFLVARR